MTFAEKRTVPDPTSKKSVSCVAQIQEDIRDRHNDGHNHQSVDVPQLCVVTVLLAPSIVAGGVPLLHPGSGVVVGLGSHTL